MSNYDMHITLFKVADWPSFKLICTNWHSKPGHHIKTPFETVLWNTWYQLSLLSCIALNVGKAMSKCQPLEHKR